MSKEYVVYKDGSVISCGLKENIDSESFEILSNSLGEVDVFETELDAESYIFDNFNRKLIDWEITEKWDYLPRTDRRHRFI